MNTLLPAGPTSYATVSGQQYRLYGVARSVSSDAAVQSALVAAGLMSLTYYTDPSTLPTDWPSASTVPLSSDERAFYAEGTWSISGQLPTSITVGSGSIIIFDVWAYAADTNSSVEQTSLTSSSTSTTSNTGTYVAIGALALAAGFAATLMLLPKHAAANPLGTSRTYVEQYGLTKVYLIYNVPTRTWRATVSGVPGYFEAAGYETAYNKMVAYLKTLPDSNVIAKESRIDRYEVRVGSSVKLTTTDFREAHASYSHWVKDAERRNGSSQEVVLLGNGKVLASFSLHGVKAKENPVTYSTSFTYRDVMVHVHEDNGTFCADYRAIEQFVPKSGGRVCSRKQSAAITTAKRRIDDILARIAKPTSMPKHTPFLSPWD